MIYQDAINKIREALDPAKEGEYDLSDMYLLKKDLAHCGGFGENARNAPISIMRAGTPFVRQKGAGYYSDGFHLVACSVCERCPEYFEKVKQS